MSQDTGPIEAIRPFWPNFNARRPFPVSQDTGPIEAKTRPRERLPRPFRCHKTPAPLKRANRPSNVDGTTLLSGVTRHRPH